MAYTYKKVNVRPAVPHSSGPAKPIITHSSGSKRHSQTPAARSSQLPAASDVWLVVYDILGREVAVLVNEKKAPGRYEVKFDGSGLSSGVYFYRIQAGDFTQTRQLMLLK